MPPSIDFMFSSAIEMLDTETSLADWMSFLVLGPSLVGEPATQIAT
jgi:hypothetical protein